MSRLLRGFLALLALGVFAFSVYLLVSASPWLLVETSILPGLPLGNLTTWAGIASLPIASALSFHEFLRRDSRLARALKTVMNGLLVLCVGWGVVSYALAGNGAFNFSNRSNAFQGSVAAGQIFWIYTISIVALTLLMSAVLLVFTLLTRRQEV